ncbi:MAG: methyltransferase domain-containing protein [Armatimonadota bacterium]|nr:methyltransferase domain-containing protein [Armatimonadota bacterium]MDR7486450.1 methyltransferase domain-containing protein [Armatimonadota bacterium]MDR7532216.1 methyltransferase domain-containing protein [Armatimonadota bacterium]MDR7537209.1 methyltransferase domain-containing protein [Armatimonadota bacterium]
MRAIWLGSFLTDTIYLTAGAWTSRFVGSPLQRAMARRRYGRLAARYDADVVPQAGYFHALDAALARLPEAPSLVLDVSTGTGAAMGLLVQRFPGCRGVAVDLAPAMLQHAVRRARGERWPVAFAVADAARLPFRDGTFDLVTVQNAFPVPRELVRVTRPGGWVVLSYSAGGPVVPWVARALARRLWRLGCATVETHPAGTGRYFLARRAQVA